MKRQIIFLALVCISSWSSGQNIVSAEYFWDNDPGAGNAIALVVTSPSQNITQNFNISTMGVSQGRHVLGVRTMDAGGVWSPAETKEVQVHRFSEMEYFWDQDPGPGNGMTLSLNTTDDDVTENYTIPTTGIKEGHHVLFVRSRGAGNSWGPVEAQPVWIENKVVAAEYFWNNDPGVGNGEALDVGTASTNVTFSDDVSTMGLDTTVDVHYLVVRTMGTNGAWSVALDTALFLGPVGIEDMVYNGMHVAIYPNPASDHTTITLFTIHPKTTTILLENSQGQIIESIYTGMVTGRNDLSLDLGGLASGVYFLRFNTQTETWTRRIVVD